MWANKAYNSLKSLGSWIRDLTLRLDFIYVSKNDLTESYSYKILFHRHGSDLEHQFHTGSPVFIFHKVFSQGHYKLMPGNTTYPSTN